MGRLEEVFCASDTLVQYPTKGPNCSEDDSRLCEHSRKSSIERRGHSASLVGEIVQTFLE